MYDKNIANIRKAQNGNDEAMTELLDDNKRTYLEYRKKVLW